MSAHFCTCAASAFHWPSEETLTAAATIPNRPSEAAYMSRKAAHPASTVLKVFLVVGLGYFQGKQESSVQSLFGYLAE